MKVFIKRLRGLFLHIIDSTQLQFILFFLLSIILLESYVDGVVLIVGFQTIGYALRLSIYMLLAISCIYLFYKVFKRVGFEGPVSQGGIFWAKVFRFVAILVFTVLISSLRIYIDLKQEIEFRGYEFCSTEKVCVYELFVSDEPRAYHEYWRLEMSTLQDVRGGVDISVPRSQSLPIGSVCYVSGVLQSPESFDGFDYVSYLRRQRVYFTIPFPSVECLSVEDRREGGVIRNWLVDFKGVLIKKLENHIPEPQVSLLSGILFGERRLFADDFDKALKDSGTTHIVAASGYNVTILILMVERLFRFLGRGWRVILSLVVIWCFCMLSGLSPSIIRATIMGSLFLISSFLGNKGSIHNIFLLSVSIFLFMDPRVLFSVGFQFSVLSVAGLIYLAPVLESVVLKAFPALVRNFIREYLVGTLSCTLFVLPLSVYTFGSLSYVSILANMLILPVLESTMLVGIVGLVVSFINPLFGKWLLLVSWVQLKYFEVVVLWLSSISGGSLSVNMSDCPFVLVIVYVSFFILIIRFYPDDGENYYLSRGSLEDYR